MDSLRVRKVGRVHKRDRMVFQSLFLAGRPLSLLALADRTAMSWSTVRSIVVKLEEWGAVSVTRARRKVSVSVDEEFLRRGTTFLNGGTE